MAMLDEAQWYSHTWVRRPPGMIHDDYLVWKPFLADHGDAFDGFAYNIELPAGQPLEEISDPVLARMWAHNNAKRIDAVGRLGDRYHIFEARNISGWSAVGQAIGYRDLWPIFYPTHAVGSAWIVTNRIDDPIRATARREQIIVWTPSDGQPTF